MAIYAFDAFLFHFMHLIVTTSTYYCQCYLFVELKLLRSTDSFRRDMKTFLFHSVYGHQDTD